MTGIDAKLAYEIGRDIFLIVVFVYTIISNRQRATKEKVSQVKDRLEATIDEQGKEFGQRLQGHANRLTKLEETQRHLPGEDSIRELSGQISKLHGDMQRMSGEFSVFKELSSVVRSQVSRMDDFLRSQK